MLNDSGFISLGRKKASRGRRCFSEPLEQRIALSVTTGQGPAGDAGMSLLAATPGTTYPGGVTVTDTQIITEQETIPRFAAQPTITAVQSGSWADTRTWSLGRIPTDQDRVSIAAGMTVSYSTVSNAAIGAVEVSGTLTFSTSTNTRLTVGTLTVMPTGTLQIGTVSTPVASGVTAEVVIADQPLNLAADPAQYGTGLIGLGTVSIHGAPVNQTWSQLAAEPRAGNFSITVGGDLSGWHAGDTLILPDTRQVMTSQQDQFLAGQSVAGYEDEEVTIDHIQGNQIFLTAPLEFDHLGAHNTSGALEILPHVARLDHNVIVRSANVGGTRGYTLFTARASVDIEYASFEKLGRTDAFVSQDDTTYGAGGNVTHVGTNESGRYAVYFDHLMGPVNASNTGFQFQFVGNTVDDSMKWAVAVNDSSYGLLSGNVIYDAQGAGFVTREGTEIGNVFQNNITMSMQGTYSDGATNDGELGDYANGGSGFWFRRGGNTVQGNVATDSSYSGFVIDGYYNTGNVTLPAFRGADTTQVGQGITSALNPAAPFTDNQAYGMTTYGMWLAFVSGNNLAPNQPTVTFQNLRIWNVFHTGVRAYHTSNVVFDNLLILGDELAQDRNDEGTRGLDLEFYENRNLKVINSRIEGVRNAVIAPNNDASQAGVPQPTVIQNTILKSYINVLVPPGLDDRPSNGNSLVLRDVKFTIIATLPKGPVPVSTLHAPTNIWMSAGGNNGEFVDYTQPSTVTVYNYNQVAGDNFQVFYREQDPSFVMPQTAATLLSGRQDGLIGSPEAGLTNAQSWQKYGIAMAGSLAPAGASASRSDIIGLIAPIQDPSTIAPRVVLTTPWNNAVIDGNQPVRIRYNGVGLMPAGGQIYFSLDGGAPISQFSDGGFYNVTAGPHTLRAYIGDSHGVQLAGTGPAAVSSITVVISPPLIDLNGPVAGSGYTANFVVGNGPVAVVDTANLTVTNTFGSTLAGAILSLSNPQSGDVLSVNTSGTAITTLLNGTTIALTGTDSLAHYQQVLRTATFNNASPNPSTVARTIYFSISNGNKSNSTSPLVSSTVLFPPIIDLNGSGAGNSFAATYMAGSAPVGIVDSSKLTVTDQASVTLVSATASLAAPQSGDVLAARTTGTGITAHFDGTNLTLTGSDSLARYQQVLRSITYNNTLVVPSTSLRVIKFSVTDSVNTSPTVISTVNVLVAQVTDRKLFYRNSPQYDVTSSKMPGFSDDNAIATDKVAYVAGTVPASFVNVSSYTQGINGIMIDILGSHPNIKAIDFIFRVGSTTNLENWALAPAPAAVTVRAGAGSAAGSDRVELVWGANAPKNAWLEVIVLPTAHTGLSANDVFFFGSEVGDTGVSNTATVAKVNVADVMGAQSHMSNSTVPIGIDNIYDFNRDGRVDSHDITQAQGHVTTSATGLPLLNITGTGPTFSIMGPWVLNALGEFDLNQGPVADYFQALAHENTLADESTLIQADRIAEALRLDDHLLDSLLASLGLA